MEVVLDCTVEKCEAGPNKVKWRTPKLPVDAALRLLDRHRTDHHGATDNGGVGSVEGGSKGRLPKIERPKLMENCTQQDFAFFKTEWNAYSTSAGIQPENIMKDQLLQCAETPLRKVIHMSMGSRLANISIADLMTEMEKAAVEKQSDMLNEVKLMEAKQERGEPVRKYLARLRGLADICKLSVECLSCHETASYVDRIIITTLVKGLVDNETKGEILSKVQLLSLEDTIAFVEASEKGQRSLAGMGGSDLAGQQVHVVKEFSDKMCWRCGEKGHTSKFKGCKAAKATCNRCGKVGHFQKCCKAKKQDGEKEPEALWSNMVMGSYGITNMAVCRSSMADNSGIKREIMPKKKKESLRSVKLQNEVYVKSAKKFVEKLADPSPTIDITLRVDFQAYNDHEPRLDCLILNKHIDKMRRSSGIWPVKFSPIADTGAQANVLGDEHLEKIGMNSASLHPTRVTMDCANKTSLEAYGVFLGYFRGKCRKTGRTLLHRGLVYVVVGSVILLSEAALKDLGVIPQSFPEIGAFGGNEELTDGTCRFTADGKFIPAQLHLPITVAAVEDNHDPIASSRAIARDSDQIKSPVKARQPEGECDPESPLPCQLPVSKKVLYRPTRVNTHATN